MQSDVTVIATIMINAHKNECDDIQKPSHAVVNLSSSFCALFLLFTSTRKLTHSNSIRRKLDSLREKKEISCENLVFLYNFQPAVLYASVTKQLHRTLSFFFSAREKMHENFFCILIGIFGTTISPQSKNACGIEMSTSSFFLFFFVHHPHRSKHRREKCTQGRKEEQCNLNDSWA